MRTKKISWQVIPTAEGVIGLANYGPSGTLFTLSRNHGVQQYDINPNGTPAQVASVQHIPANTPPTPPTTLDERNNLPVKSRGSGDAAVLPSVSDTGESSTDEGATKSPLQRIAREMESLDALQDELRDKVMPLSPTSSRTSSVSSRSSGGRRNNRKYLYDRPDSSRAPSSVGGQTDFSIDSPSLKPGHESMSIRSLSSLHSHSRRRTSNLRNQVVRSPDDGRLTAAMDLFPNARARVRDVPFRPPHYGNVARTPELLQREMLSVIFGWNDTARSLIRDEMQRHKAGSPAAVLLAKWLGDIGADHMASLIGSESMTSADWMMLALSSIGVDSQKKVGEAFVQRLLEKGDIHPAVAILVGLGEYNDAIEVYVSQKYWLEAVLLTCVTCPADWQRTSHLIREWGATAVQHGQSDLAVRCFSCTSIETSEPWFSPRAQDAAYTAQQERLTGSPSAGPLTSPPLSPPSRSGSQRLAEKNASLKLITTFGDTGAPVSNTMDIPTPTNAMLGLTPIAPSAMPHSALSPGGQDLWQQTRSRNLRDPTSVRTATPGGLKKRLPSRSDIERVKQETAKMETPITAARDVPPPIPSGPGRRTPSLGSNNMEPTTALKATVYTDKLAPDGAVQDENHMPSPSAGAFTRYRENSRARRNTSQERKPDGLAVQIIETRYAEDASLGPGTGASLNTPAGAASLTSTKSAKARSIDEYISGVEEALGREALGPESEIRERSRPRAASKKREESRGRRGTSRPRELSETRGRHDVRYIRPAKRSPSSPVPMSPEEIAQASQVAKPKPEPATSEDESFYKIASPVSLKSFRSEPKQARKRQSPERRIRSDTTDEPNRPKSPDGQLLVVDSTRGRTDQRQAGSTARSPSSPLPMPLETQVTQHQTETDSAGRRVRLRSDSHTGGDLQSRRTESRERCERSTSRRPVPKEDALGMPMVNLSKSSISEDLVPGSAFSATADESESKARILRRKELAQKELEERRQSLARRPSAPTIPLPGEMQGRPPMAPRANTELGNSPTSYAGPLPRAQTVDPDQMARYGKLTGTSTPSAPIGLPATPRAMRHPRYMSTDPNEREATPPVPEIPEYASNLSSVGSSLSQVSNSNLDFVVPSNVTSNLTSNVTTNLTSNASYLTSNVSYDSSSAMSSQVSSNIPMNDEDSVAPLLPSTVFGQKFAQAPYTRAASAPPEKMTGGVHPAYKSSLPPSNRRMSHVRKISPPDLQDDKSGTAPPVTSIDEALASSDDQQVVVIPEAHYSPPMLPELQHLAGPIPPPPPPKIFTQPQNGQVNNSGVINIAIDEDAPSSAVDVPTTLPSTTYPHPMERATTASPAAQRRGRGSVSETFGSRFRDLGERMRSTSRNRTRPTADYKPPPYETVLPPVPLQHQPLEYETRAKSPYEEAMAGRSHGHTRFVPPPPALPIALPEGKLEETTIPPSTLPRSQSAQGGYRNPKEIRANMPPETLQQGVYQGPGGYL